MGTPVSTVWKTGLKWDRLKTQFRLSFSAQIFKFVLRSSSSCFADNGVCKHWKNTVCECSLEGKKSVLRDRITGKLRWIVYTKWTSFSEIQQVVEAGWNVMAHAQKPDFVFRRNGRVHLNRQGRQFCRLLAAEVCASAVVMLAAPCSEVVRRVLATYSIRQFPLHFPTHASPCAITFQLESKYNEHQTLKGQTRRRTVPTTNLI